MRKPVQVIGTTLAAAAIVGATGTAAFAQGGYDDHGGFGRDAGFGGYGYGHHDYGDLGDPGPSFGHRYFGDDDRSDNDFGDRFDRGDNGPSDTSAAPPAAPAPGTGDDTAPVHSFPPADPGPTFEQRKSAIVSALTAAEDRLTSLQTALRNAAATDPTGRAAQMLSFVSQARDRVESLLAQAQAATTDDQLDAVLHQWWSAGPGATSIPAPAQAG